MKSYCKFGLLNVYRFSCWGGFIIFFECVICFVVEFLVFGWFFWVDIVVVDLYVVGVEGLVGRFFGMGLEIFGGVWFIGSVWFWGVIVGLLEEEVGCELVEIIVDWLCCKVFILVFIK